MSRSLRRRITKHWRRIRRRSMDNLFEDYCANPECSQPISFGPTVVDLPRHGRKIDGFMATCGHCGNTQFDDETMRTLVELGYIELKEPPYADERNNGQ